MDEPEPFLKSEPHSCLQHIPPLMATLVANHTGATQTCENFILWKFEWIQLISAYNHAQLLKQTQLYVIRYFPHTMKSSGSLAGGGGSYLPTRKFSMPVQATITPISYENKSICCLLLSSTSC